MAENTKKSPADRRQSGRLQRKAPATIQINRATDWNVAIPLLSPLVTSPVSSNLELCSSSTREKEAEREAEKPSATAAAAFKEWKHPAAPFCFDPAPLVKFVCTGSNDR